MTSSRALQHRVDALTAHNKELMARLAETTAMLVECSKEIERLGALVGARESIQKAQEASESTEPSTAGPLDVDAIDAKMKAVDREITEAFNKQYYGERKP